MVNYSLLLPNSASLKLNDWGYYFLFYMCAIHQSNFNFIENRYQFSLNLFNHFKLFSLCVSTAESSGDGSILFNNGEITLERNIFKHFF